MRLYKAIAQIFLFLFILNFTFASIALFSQTQTQTQTTTDDEMHVDSGTTRSGEDVTTMEEVSEKVHTQQSDEEEEEEFPEWQGGHPSIDGRLHLRFNIARRTYSSDPAQDKFLNDEMTRKLKEYIILGAIAGSMTGIANAMQKEIIGTVSPNAYVLFFFFYLSFPPPPLSCQLLTGVNLQTYF